MARIIIIAIALVATLLAGCRTNKDVTTHKNIEVDSVDIARYQHKFSALDSIVRNIDFSFDTLKANIEQPVEPNANSRKTSITIINGRVKDSRSQERNQLEEYNRLDSIDFKANVNESEDKSTTTTHIYNPPKVGPIICILLVVGGVIILIRKGI